MTSRKAIVAMINGVVHIDPSDANKETLTKIQAQFNNSIKIKIAPISTWMPESGTKALMNEALKDLGIGQKTKQPVYSKKKFKKLYGIK